MRWRRVIQLLALLLAAPILYYSCRGPASPDLAELTAVFGGEADPALAAPAYPDAELTSSYLTMRDGVMIAVDLYLPKGLESGRKIPALIMANRYWRRPDLRFPFNLFRRVGAFQRFFAGHGYAVVSVDARGSGASFGHQAMPWSADELQDYREILDWIARQGWSNGRIGAVGVSYGGTCAEFMAALGRPALKAAAPQFSLFDAYTDIAFPGGVMNEWFLRRWSETNARLDAGETPAGLGFFRRLAVRGPAPVADGPWGSGRALLDKALKEHAASGDIYQAAKSVTYRDDAAQGVGLPINAFSPHALEQKTERGGVAFYAWGGWFDGAYADAALKRRGALTNPQRVVIGPWNHGGEQAVDPLGGKLQAPSTKVQWLDLLRFFNHWLKAEGRKPAEEIIYYTLGEGKWKQSPSWPPAGQTSRLFYLDKDRRLSPTPPVAETGEDVYAVDFTAGSGETSRWRTQLGRGAVAYPDRAAADAKLLVHESAPLEKDLEITGDPAVTLFFSASAEDCAFHVYLEEVDGNGRVNLLTEGVFRALHRNVSFDRPPYPVGGSYHTFRRDDGDELEPGEPAKASFQLLPVSALVRKGHKLRLAIAGADKDEFARVPAEGAVTLAFYRNAIVSSFLELPVIDPTAPPKVVGPLEDDEPAVPEPVSPPPAKGKGKKGESSPLLDEEE